MKSVWTLLARNRDYRLLLSANLVSQAGDWILATGMVFYIYVSTGSALASGAMLVAALVPQLLLGSLAGVFADRWDRRRTMIVSNVLLALSCLPLFAVTGTGSLWVVYAVVFGQGIVEQFFLPAESAMVPQVVAEKDLVAANALNGQNRQIARLLGAAIGGALAATGGIALVAIVDLLTYAVAAAAVMMMRTRVAKPEPTAPQDARPPLIRHEWIEGVRLCFTSRELSTLFVYRVLSGFGEGILSVLLAPLLISVLHTSNTQYGAVVAAQAIGGIAGGFAIAVLASRVVPRALLGWGALVFGLLDLLLALYPLALAALWPAFVIIIVVGLPAAAMGAAFATLTQLHTPDRFRGRVFGAINTGWGLAMLIGTVLAGVLGDAIGIIAVISLQGVIHMLAGPYVLARLRNREPAAAPVPAPIPAEETS